jgi:hypothetical protein
MARLLLVSQQAEGLAFVSAHHSPQQPSLRHMTFKTVLTAG